ncbi:MAG: methyltransferase domain-containing protein [Bacteroidota bacterium]|jgi:ubiquinone/menaquinone biosynthesis C-methylase UbiE
MNKLAQLRDFYENEFYEFECARERDLDIFTQSRYRILDKLIPKDSINKSWLDVGCGFGDTLKILEYHGCYPLFGIDLSSKSLHHVKDKTSCQLLLQADAALLPFKDKSIHGVMASELIEHTLDWKNVIGEICRIAQKWVIVSFPTDYDWLYTRLGIFKNPYINLTFDDAIKNHVGHISIPRLNDVRKVLKANGFMIYKIRGFYSILPPPFKLNFHYPDLHGLSKLLYDIAAKVDHSVSWLIPFRLIGLSTIIIAKQHIETNKKDSKISNRR